MSVDQGLVDWVTECLEPIGRVTMRFKGDAINAEEFSSAGRGKFEFSGKDGKVATMNYWSAPLDAYDDPDALRDWARLGIAAGERAPRKKRKR
jgi:DNA transformation protein